MIEFGRETISQCNERNIQGKPNQNKLNSRYILYFINLRSVFMLCSFWIVAHAQFMPCYSMDSETGECSLKELLTWICYLLPLLLCRVKRQGLKYACLFCYDALCRNGTRVWSTFEIGQCLVQNNLNIFWQFLPYIISRCIFVLSLVYLFLFFKVHILPKGIELKKIVQSENLGRKCLSALIYTPEAVDEQSKTNM